MFAPEVIDETVRGDDLVGMQAEDRQESPLPNSTQGHGFAVVDPHLNWSEDPQLESGPHELKVTGVGSTPKRRERLVSAS